MNFKSLEQLPKSCIFWLIGSSGCLLEGMSKFNLLALWLLIWNAPLILFLKSHSSASLILWVFKFWRNSDLSQYCTLAPVKQIIYRSWFVFPGKGGLLLRDGGGALLHLHAAAALRLQGEGINIVLEQWGIMKMHLNLNEFGFQVSVSTTSSSFSVTEAIFSPYPASLQPLPFATTEKEVVHFSCQTLPSHGQATALQVS